MLRANAELLVGAVGLKVEMNGIRKAMQGMCALLHGVKETTGLVNIVMFMFVI